MKNENKTHSKRVRNLIAISSLSAIVLLVAAFAWFIGMQTVSVNEFEIEIAATEGLALSVDGETFGDKVTINKGNHKTVFETNNTNNWAGRGLIPMSSVGEMDEAASRMILFEKASLTSTPGGYRLMASRVPNHEEGNPERDGYVVFDLFIKNLSGRDYIKTLNELDEEAIYLTPESEVTVSESGVENTGIENSVRVAFAQIGRVIGTTTDQNTITGITCAEDQGDVTGICRTAQIWEPNDTKHVQNAINWYNTACKLRTGTGITEDDYTTSCKAIVNGQTYPTYAVKKAIGSSDKVDVYDGAAFNGYERDEEPAWDLLEAYDTFTDTKKFKRGNDRPLFMTLAANSITKVRVYVYLEGQDIDNYDFAQIGRAISVKFGFTKQPFIEDDFNYEGPIVNEGEGPDALDVTTRPVLAFVDEDLNASREMTLEVGATFEDPEITVKALVDGTFTEDSEAATKLVKSGHVDNSETGTYYLTYLYTDGNGNTSHINLKVIVE